MLAKLETPPPFQKPRNVHVGAIGMGREPGGVDRADRSTGEDRKRCALAPLSPKNIDDASNHPRLVGPTGAATGKHDARTRGTRGNNSHRPVYNLSNRTLHASIHRPLSY